MPSFVQIAIIFVICVICGYFVFAYIAQKNTIAFQAKILKYERDISKNHEKIASIREQKYRLFENKFYESDVAFYALLCKRFDYINELMSKFKNLDLETKRFHHEAIMQIMKDHSEDIKTMLTKMYEYFDMIKESLTKETQDTAQPEVEQSSTETEA